MARVPRADRSSNDYYIIITNFNNLLSLHASEGGVTDLAGILYSQMIFAAAIQECCGCYLRLFVTQL